MAYRGGAQKVQIVMVQAIKLISVTLKVDQESKFGFMNRSMWVEGCIVGFDEYMNLVLDDAEEVLMKTQNRKRLGGIFLKGDNITLIQQVQ